MVAFDKNLNRLGYGGGYYDRLIERLSKEAIEKYQGNFHQFDGSPQQSEGSPNQSDGSPQQSEGSPQQSEDSPQQREGSPQQSDDSPQQSEGSPHQKSNYNQSRYYWTDWEYSDPTLPGKNCNWYKHVQTIFLKLVGIYASFKSYLKGLFMKH